MARRQLFEFSELPWCPRLFRDAITDVLTLVSTRFDIYGAIVPKLGQALEKLDCREIIDLCSGGSGPIMLISDQLAKDGGRPIRITLTDLYPNLEAFRRTGLESGGRIGWVEHPVDATEVPEHLKGFRTAFAALHHFDPDSARMVLRDAADKGEGIGVFEFTGRDLRSFVYMLASPFAMLLALPLLKPFTWKRFLWTYVIPVLPLIAAWDGLVSNLRSYSPEELRRLASGIGAGEYAWESGRIYGEGLRHLTYLLGYPERP